MDFYQIWSTAINNIAASKSSDKEKAIIRLLQMQVSWSLEGNAIKFQCSNPVIYRTFTIYSDDFYQQIKHLLGREELGMLIELAGSPGVTAPAPKPEEPAPPAAADDQNKVFEIPLEPMPSIMQSSYSISGDLMGANWANPYAYNPNSGIAIRPAQVPYIQAQVNYGSYNVPAAPKPALVTPAQSKIVHKPAEAPAPIAVQAVPEPVSASSYDAINPNKTFENYVTDPENRILHATAVAVAANPGTPSYNPLYIYGPSGLGKTHLLFAIANRIRKTQPDISIIYTRAEEFIRHFVESMANIKKNPFDDQQVHFQDIYTKHNVLIVDDIQNFIKGPKARDTFFDIINEFIDKPNRQLILASDVPPSNLTGFNQRLTSRFGAGVCCEVMPPGADTREAITINKCQEIHVNLPDSIIKYIAAHISSNVREIEGAIKTLNRHIITYHSISFDDAVKILGNLVNSSNQATTVEMIKVRVAKEFNITVPAMESAEKKKAVSTARSMAMCLARELIPTLSLTDIGRAFNKDHSSVHEAIKRIRKRMNADPEQAAIYQRLKSSMNKD